MMRTALISTGDTYFDREFFSSRCLERYDDISPRSSSIYGFTFCAYASAYARISSEAPPALLRFPQQH